MSNWSLSSLHSRRCTIRSVETASRLGFYADAGQIYHLRTLPKALVTPVTEMFNFLTLPSIGGDAPAKLYARIQKIAIDGSDDIESFKQSWKSSDTQDLWQRTLNEPYPQGTDVWRTDYIKMVEESKAYQQRQASIIERAAIDVRNPKDVMDDFREKQQSVKVELDGPSSPLPCNIRVAGMIFRVIATAQGDKVEYGVQHNKGSGPTHLQDGILKHLNARRAKGNLEYLLVRTMKLCA